MKIRLCILFILFSASSFSCDCPLDLPPVSLETVKNYDVIFYGKVDSVSPCTTKGLAIAYFTISELYKGQISQHQAINFDCSSECMMSFAKGEKWLIFSHFQRFDELLVNFCEHSKNASQWSLEKDKAILNEILGIQEFVEKNVINDQQEDLRGRNKQPSSMNKVWLLVISFLVMAIVYFVTRNKKK